VQLYKRDQNARAWKKKRGKSEEDCSIRGCDGGGEQTQYHIEPPEKLEHTSPLEETETVGGERKKKKERWASTRSDT